MIIDKVQSEILKLCSKKGSVSLDDLVAEIEGLDIQEAKDWIKLLLRDDAIEIEEIVFQRKE